MYFASHKASFQIQKKIIWTHTFDADCISVCIFQCFYCTELLESLKKNSAGRTITPETSPLERPATASEEMVKKLHAKNASYKKKIEELRANVIELTKALSLAEVNH